MTKLAGAIAIEVLIAMPLLAQCALCQASLANAENGDDLIGGFRQGIGLLLLVMGILGVVGWKAASQARQRFLSEDREGTKSYESTQVCTHAENSAAKT